MVQPITYFDEICFCDYSVFYVEDGVKKNLISKRQKTAENLENQTLAGFFTIFLFLALGFLSYFISYFVSNNSAFLEKAGTHITPKKVLQLDPIKKENPDFLRQVDDVLNENKNIAVENSENSLPQVEDGFHGNEPILRKSDESVTRSQGWSFREILVKILVQIAISAAVNFVMDKVSGRPPVEPPRPPEVAAGVTLPSTVVAPGEIRSPVTLVTRTTQTEGTVGTQTVLSETPQVLDELETLHINVSELKDSVEKQAQNLTELQTGQKDLQEYSQENRRLALAHMRTLPLDAVAKIRSNYSQYHKPGPLGEELWNLYTALRNQERQERQEQDQQRLAQQRLDQQRLDQQRLESGKKGKKARGR